ncbi:Hypothetical protein Nlim_0078 [Candidatus Nitrosarchaeum limnium SFB1]|jgi:hypothetical protein|uniref:Uncharacterized protein n=1 Tax=Candidatus Nitrosarchaeum limnium SFB1 TaxID=886738 RepID=F3KHY7_9ARCH|nr:Hypothetical protein Nlim_0078 [Candidatus Nitrosarchaeum limnium SFB1]
MKKLFMKYFFTTALSIIAILVLSIGAFSFVIPDAYAAPITVSTFQANDPDDGDSVFSNGDTILIAFNVGTNATNGGTMTSTEFNANFTISGGISSFDGTFSGVWQNSAQELLLTWTSVGSNIPVVGTTTIEEKGTTNISSSAGTNADVYSDTPDTLTGDFGLFTATSSTSNGGTCSGDCVEPTLGVNEKGERRVSNGFTYNGYSVDVDRFFTPYPLITAEVGKENKAEFKIYENLGPDNIRHFSFAFGLAKGQIISQSVAMIELDIDFDGTKSLTVTDPENALDNVRVETSHVSCDDSNQTDCLEIIIYHTFRTPLDFNIVATDVWDTARLSWQNYYNHGIEVVGESLNPAKEYDGINRGHIYHLTETGKTTAVDEFGNSWTLSLGVWNKDYVAPQRIVEDAMPSEKVWTIKYPLKDKSQEEIISAFTKDGVEDKFLVSKYGQSLLAENRLNQMCPGCFDKPYDKIDNIFSYDFPERLNKLDNPEIQSKIRYESHKAETIMNYILDPASHPTE